MSECLNVWRQVPKAQPSKPVTVKQDFPGIDLGTCVCLDSGPASHVEVDMSTDHTNFDFKPAAGAGIHIVCCNGSDCEHIYTAAAAADENCGTESDHLSRHAVPDGAKSTGAALGKDQWPNSPEVPGPLRTGLPALV